MKQRKENKELETVNTIWSCIIKLMNIECKIDKNYAKMNKKYIQRNMMS